MKTFVVFASYFTWCGYSGYFAGQHFEFIPFMMVVNGFGGYFLAKYWFR